MAKYTTKDPIYTHLKTLEAQVSDAEFADDSPIWEEIALAKHAIENPSDTEFNGLPYIAQASGLATAMIGIKTELEKASNDKCIETFQNMQQSIGEPNSAIAPPETFYQTLKEQLGEFRAGIVSLQSDVKTKLTEYITSVETLLDNVPQSGWASTHVDAQIMKGLDGLNRELSSSVDPQGNLKKMMETMLETAAPAARSERQEAIGNI